MKSKYNASIPWKASFVKWQKKAGLVVKKTGPAGIRFSLRRVIPVC